MTTKNVLFFLVFLTAIFALSCKENSESSIVKISAKRGTITLTSTGVFAQTAMGPRVLLNNHSSYSMISFQVQHDGKSYEASLDQSWPCSDLSALRVPGLRATLMELDTINPDLPLEIPSHGKTAQFFQFGAGWFAVKSDGTADNSMDTIEDGSQYEDLAPVLKERFPYKYCFVGMARTSLIGLGKTYSGTPILQNGKVIGLYSGSNYSAEYSFVSLIPYGLFVEDHSR